MANNYKYVKANLIAEVKREIENIIIQFSNDPDVEQMDIRLRLYEGSSYTLIGDCDSDPDGRGTWSSGIVRFDEGFDPDQEAKDIVEKICNLLPEGRIMDDLDHTIALLVEEIHTYDSDFWTSADEGVTIEEARKVASNLIDDWMLNIDDNTVRNQIAHIRKVQEEVGFVEPSTDFLDVYEG